MSATYPRRTPLQLKLAHLGMCREGRAWAGAKDIYEVWDTCRRGDWMLHLATKADAGRPAVIAILDWLQAHLCCIRADIPAALLALPDIDRWVLLNLAAMKLKELVPSTLIAEKLGL
jgi:hypothetical protein